MAAPTPPIDQAADLLSSTRIAPAPRRAWACPSLFWTRGSLSPDGLWSAARQARRNSRGGFDRHRSAFCDFRVSRTRPRIVAQLGGVQARFSPHEARCSLPCFGAPCINGIHERADRRFRTSETAHCPCPGRVIPDTASFDKARRSRIARAREASVGADPPSVSEASVSVWPPAERTPQLSAGGATAIIANHDRTPYDDQADAPLGGSRRHDSRRSRRRCR